MNPEEDACLTWVRLQYQHQYGIDPKISGASCLLICHRCTRLLKPDRRLGSHNHERLRLYRVIHHHHDAPPSSILLRSHPCCLMDRLLLKRLHKRCRFLWWIWSRSTKLQCIYLRNVQSNDDNKRRKNERSRRSGQDRRQQK